MIPWEALGFHLVGNASNGLDALELVERLEPDLLLTDIRMPFISGIELARQVREIRPAMHIAFLSGFDDFEYAKQAIQYNIISYMLKPLTMDGLAAELKAIHEKIDARYAGLRRADSAHADRAALIIPLVLARYENAPENVETRLRQAAVDCGLLRGTDDRSTLVVMVAALDGPVDYEAGFTQLVEQSANKYLRHFVFYCFGRAVALLLGNPSDFDEYLHILADEICQLADRALGRSASVGVSREFARFSDLNDAYKQAIEALRAAAEGEGGVSFTADARKTGSLCERALEIIEQHYMDEDLSLASLSAMLDVSPNHLSACIKKSEGETFINILVRRRMETAQTLLLTTDLQIQEIARRCGYTDQHYFSYCFKKYSVTSPVALRRARPTGSLYGAVLYSEPQRFALFTDALTEYRRLARTLPVDELIEELLARTGYLAAVGALPDGPRCREDLLSFTAWAAGAGRAGLPSLIRAMDAAAANGGLSQSAGGQTRPGCVSIMTVHRSKGLEFPVVFVADTDHKFNQSDAIRPVLTHSRLGVGVMLRAPRAAKRFKTLPYAALAQAIRTETLSEEMRVLYVALTRAQDALIITVPMKKTASSLKLPALCAAAEATGPEAMRSMTSWAGWILTAALLHPDSSALWEYTSFLPHYGLHRAPLAIRVLPLPEETEQPPAPPAPAADPAVVEMLKASFAWRSPREALEKVPAKVSVSAVAHAARPVALERPAFLQKTGMTGAERGTAIHAFMQSVPFDGPAPDLDAEVRRQTDLQLLDPALADKLDLDAVRPFFASAVWRRIRLAKQILREEPFITALPAAEVTPAAGQGSAAAAEVLVQGIADLVLVFDEHAEILDYKTDRSRDAQYYIDEYAAQLRLYRRAFAQRLAVPVTKLTIYSFAIEDEIDVPLG